MMPHGVSGDRGHRGWFITVGLAALVVGGVGIAMSLWGGEALVARSTSNETAERPLSEADRKVIDLVPRSFGESCVATDPLPGGAVGSVTCTQGEYAGRYSSYATRDDLSAAFARSTAGRGLSGTSCRDEAVASGFYTVGGSRRGAVACYVEHPTPLEFVPTIVWTDESLRVLGLASTTIVTDYEGNVADLSLYEWWRTSAGPGQNRNLPEKDDAAELPSGTFRSIITKEQVGPLNEGGVNDRWVGTWTITLEGAEFVESFDDGLKQPSANQSVTDDQSYRIKSGLLWGKGQRMILRRFYEDGIPPLQGITRRPVGQARVALDRGGWVGPERRLRAFGVTAFCERLTESLRVRLKRDGLVFSNTSPQPTSFANAPPSGVGCRDFQGVATFQPWERIS
jgi:hypothetical protein